MDFESLTLNEVEMIENLCGVSIDKAVADGEPKGKNLRAIIYVMTRRTNPDFTIEEAGNMTLTDAMKKFGVDQKKA